MTGTALDRYRSAKAALDSFDSFTKLCAGSDGASSRVTADGSMAWTPANRHNPQRMERGFNEFLAKFIMRARPALMAEYRAVLVQAVADTKHEAEAEAVALIREVAPT